MFEADNKNKQEKKLTEVEIISPDFKLPQSKDYIEIFNDQALFEVAEAYQIVVDLAQEIKEAGGRALIVGGAVRDYILSKIPKDFDLEVYGLAPEKIEEIVKSFGKVANAGKAFGILKLFTPSGLDIDVSIPRRDSKSGTGHRGFQVATDPNMSITEAARRRDFTFNSLSANPLTGDIYDPFGGIADLQNRTLKVTDSERFKDDPLRVLRALQFSSRFGLKVEKQSLKILKDMIPELNELPKERIGEEWKKLLLKSTKPSIGLSLGMSLGVFDEIHPEFPPLAHTPQEADWHPEGDVWIHTLMVVDEASKIVRKNNLDKEASFVVLLASLCHDLGKPATTSQRADGRIVSPGHEQAGAEPTRKFLSKIGVANLIKDKVVKLVENHLQPTLLYVNEIIQGGKVSDGAIRRLANRIYPATISELAMVAEADHLGRGEFAVDIKEQLILNSDVFEPAPWLLARARQIEVLDNKPQSLTRGQDWISFGFRPGKNIGQAIELADQLRDKFNFTKENIFNLLLGLDESLALLKMREMLQKDEQK